MKKVLIIEDDTSLAKMYQTKIIKDGGFDVVAADNGISGLEEAKREKPDLILLDIVMPGMDGRMVFQELRKDDNTKNIPVIFLTNLGSESEVQKNPEIGIMDYLIKADCTPAEVVRRVKMVLGDN